MRPYGYTNASAPDESFIHSLSNAMKDEIHSVHGQHYTPEKSEQLYYCYGIAADWYVGGVSVYCMVAVAIRVKATEICNVRKQ